MSVLKLRTATRQSYAAVKTTACMVLAVMSSHCNEQSALHGAGNTLSAITHHLSSHQVRQEASWHVKQQAMIYGAVMKDLASPTPSAVYCTVQS